MIDATSKNLRRQRRQRRARSRFQGTAQRPRLNVFRSLNHIYAQLIDDQAGRTLAAASSQSPGPKAGGATGNVAAAQAVGQAIAARAQEKGIRAVVFDRAGYPYHGRVKALAEAARQAGLEF
ncbi:MAG TPA: 50S ribosomal protein L18 [Terriglobales bacterium]|nr:50S ribosomal protein L18 [Terriglobales bacterium]